MAYLSCHEQLHQNYKIWTQVGFYQTCRDKQYPNKLIHYLEILQNHLQLES